LLACSPEDKYNLVKASQKSSHTDGRCGDGANDAPALRQAQIVIAVSTATNVARLAAGSVLTEPGLAGIIAAVNEGRATFRRILLVFGSQATICAIRGLGRAWGSRPSVWLAASSVADVLLASSLAAGGLAMAPLANWIVTGVLSAASVLAVVLAMAKVPVFRCHRIAETRALLFHKMLTKTSSWSRAQSLVGAQLNPRPL
jgi:cation transport ATPase